MIMRKVYLIALCLAASSCTAAGLLHPEPEVNPEGTSLLLVSFADSEIWTEQDAVGVYGSLKGDNSKFVPMSSCWGSEGQATLYGSPVEGLLRAYYPYDSAGLPCIAEGLVPLSSLQKYCPDARSHFRVNGIAAAEGEAGSLVLRYIAGAVHFRVEAQFTGEVKKVELSSLNDVLSGMLTLQDGKVSSGTGSVTVRGVGSPQGPFDIWFLLPEGAYKGLELTIVTDAGEVVKAVSGTLPVYMGKVSETVVKDETYEYAGSAYEIISGEFDR